MNLETLRANLVSQFTCEPWDGRSPINGATAEQIFAAHTTLSDKFLGCILRDSYGEVVLFQTTPPKEVCEPEAFASSVMESFVDDLLVQRLEADSVWLL